MTEHTQTADGVAAWQDTRLQALESFLEASIRSDSVTDGIGGAADINSASVNEANRLLDAMAYSTLAAGKRIRALLVFATGHALDVPLDRLTPIAAALECIHAYSLIHDDLPAMDDDNLRRGTATNHIAFDEATAILAGDGLLTLAFELASAPESSIPTAQKLKIVHQLAKSAGKTGMVGGQMMDIQATGKLVSLEHLQTIHAAKTGALIKAAVRCGAYCADSAHLNEATLTGLSDYADKIGLAFQIMDDVLDETSDTQTLGKLAGADRQMQKSTYPQLLGLHESRALAENLLQEALESIQSISDNTEPLKYLANRIITRSN